MNEDFTISKKVLGEGTSGIVYKGCNNFKYSYLLPSIQFKQRTDFDCRYKLQTSISEKLFVDDLWPTVNQTTPVKKAILKYLFFFPIPGKRIKGDKADVAIKLEHCTAEFNLRSLIGLNSEYEIYHKLGACGTQRVSISNK